LSATARMLRRIMLICGKLRFRIRGESGLHPLAWTRRKYPTSPSHVASKCMLHVIDFNPAGDEAIEHWGNTCEQALCP
jgi:hypothetical protein